MNLKVFLQSDRFRELFIYGVVGVITTAINLAVYFLFSRISAAVLSISVENAVLILLSTAIGWAASVAFAFWANKKFVFRSPGWGWNTLRRELPEFITARLLSLGFDAAFVEVAVHSFGFSDQPSKLVSNVIVIIINYFASKFWIFKRKDASK